MVDETRDGERHTHISQAGDGAFRIAEERRNDDDVADKTS